MSLFEFGGRLRVFLFQFIDLGNVSGHGAKVRLDLQSLPALFQRFIVIARIKENDCEVFIDAKRKRIQLLRFFDFLKCLIQPAL